MLLNIPPNITYPQMEKEMVIEGTVYIRFAARNRVKLRM